MSDETEPYEPFPSEEEWFIRQLGGRDNYHLWCWNILYGAPNNDPLGVFAGGIASPPTALVGEVPTVQVIPKALAEKLKIKP